MTKWLPRACRTAGSGPYACGSLFLLTPQIEGPKSDPRFQRLVQIQSDLLRTSWEQLRTQSHTLGPRNIPLSTRIPCGLQWGAATHLQHTEKRGMHKNQEMDRTILPNCKQSSSKSIGGNEARDT